MKVMSWVAAAVVAGVVALLLWPSGAQVTTVTVRTAAHHRVSMTVDDPERGVNTLDFDITDYAGRPIDAAVLTVELAMPRMGHALPPATATRTGPGRYRAANISIPMSGQWEVAVSVPGTDQAVLPLLVG